MKQIARWVRLHPCDLSQKVAIIVEHFRTTVAWRLNGEAKAMVVTGSRKEAVRYKLAIDSYMKKNGYQDIAAIVAFSGDVIDPESGANKFNELNMNPGLRGRNMPMPLIPMNSIFSLLPRSFRLDSISRNWLPCMSIKGLLASTLCKVV